MKEQWVDIEAKWCKWRLCVVFYFVEDEPFENTVKHNMLFGTNLTIRLNWWRLLIEIIA